MVVEELISLYHTYGNGYLQAVLIFFSFFLISKLFVLFSEKYLKNWVQKTETELDDKLIHKVDGPISKILLLIGIRLALVPIMMPLVYVLFIHKIILSTIVVITTYIILSITDELIDAWGAEIAKRTHKRIDKQVISLLHRISRLFLGVIGIVMVFDIWSIETSAILASLGVAGIAVAFALQPTLSNLFSGVSMIIDRNIKVGDMIQIKDGSVGTVMDVGLRSTRIRTFNNEVIILPNSQMANQEIKNFAPPDPTGRLVLPFNVAYGSNIEKVKKTVEDAVKGIEGIMKDPKPYVRFLEMADSSLQFKAYIWVEDITNRFSIKDIANTKIYNALNKAKINIPFPQMDVHLRKE